MTDATPAPEAQNPNAVIEEAALAAESLAQSQQQVSIQFPAIGYIDPETELAKLQQMYTSMTTEDRATYPEKIRAKILAFEAAKGTVKEAETPAWTEEEVALALFIVRMSSSPLTPEDVTAKVTGVAKPKPKKETKATKEEEGKNALLSIFGKKP